MFLEGESPTLRDIQAIFKDFKNFKKDKLLM